MEDDDGVHWVVKKSDQHFYVKPGELIKEVEVRPAIYTPEHPDRLLIPDFKNTLWKQIAEKLIKGWTDLTKVEQSETIIELQKKWRNLKDSFRKEYRLRKNRAHEGTKIKRKYIYFNKLLFLKPIIENSTTTSIPKRRRQIVTNNSDHETYETGASCDQNMTLENNDMPNYINNMNTLSGSCMMTEEFIDEDKTFLLSLVPSFKRMNNDQKLTAKVEILNVIRNIQMTQCYNTENDNENNSMNPINTDGSEEYVYAATSSRKKRKSKLKMEVEKLDSEEETD